MNPDRFLEQVSDISAKINELTSGIDVIEGLSKRAIHSVSSSEEQSNHSAALNYIYNM